jgi:hypothetical protein
VPGSQGGRYGAKWRRQRRQRALRRGGRALRREGDFPVEAPAAGGGHRCVAAIVWLRSRHRLLPPRKASAASAQCLPVLLHRSRRRPLDPIQRTYAQFVNGICSWRLPHTLFLATQEGNFCALSYWRAVCSTACLASCSASGSHQACLNVQGREGPLHLNSGEEPL